jgi:pilus assembly protein CpaC
LKSQSKLAALIGAALILAPGRAIGPASAFEVIEPKEEREIEITVGAGQLIRVDGEFSSLFVANPDVADVEVKSPRMLYLTGVGVGETTVFAVDEADNVLMSANIRVVHNAGALAKGIARVAPGGGVTATTVDQSLIVSGTVASPEQAANVMEVAAQFVDDPSRVVNRLNITAPTQVNLQVRIAEVSRSVDRQIGIRWNELSYTSGGGRESVDFRGGAAPIPGGFATQVLRVGQLNIDVVLEALSEEGLVAILAEPNLTARSGETASFLAGGEFPYPVAQGDDTNTIEFKDYGIALNFTPTVVDGGRISLNVATEVSDLDFSNAEDGVPALITRRADTTVDLGSGQTFAIAGLMQNRSAQDASRMPGLGAVPVVGALFRSSGFRRGQTELVILVTPILVNPTNGARLRAPTDRYLPPNDFERIVLGRFQGNAQASEAAQSRLGQRRLNGSSGFVFD